jgi:hypothetical protein
MATDQGSTARRSSGPTGGRRLLFYTVLAAIALLVPFGIAELFLRVFPIPGVELDVSVYDDLVGYGLYPHGTRVYRGDGGVVRRKINSLGYLDREPETATDPSELKIGFFGDSYTEARQVPLEQTFSRLIEQDLSPRVETLAFGQSGFNTLQSYLTSTKWIDHFDIDLVVYVFVENDLGDQLRQVVARAIPYPVLTDAAFSIDTSFREAGASRRSVFQRIGDPLTANSLVFATLSQRLRLLLTYGPQVGVTEAQRSMGAANEAGDLDRRIPNENDPPSLWPANLRNEAIKVTEATILEWRNYVRQRSKEFAILYIPRESELRKPTEQQDSWKAWLEQFCLKEDISFIDPTPQLLEEESAGHQVFHDHFTPFGHIAAANAFENWFQNTKAYTSN